MTAAGRVYFFVTPGDFAQLVNPLETIIILLVTTMLKAVLQSVKNYCLSFVVQHEHLNVAHVACRVGNLPILKEIFDDVNSRSDQSKGGEGVKKMKTASSGEVSTDVTCVIVFDYCNVAVPYHSTVFLSIRRQSTYNILKDPTEHLRHSVEDMKKSLSVVFNHLYMGSPFGKWHIFKVSLVSDPRTKV